MASKQVENRIHYSELYEIYGSLLTKKQQKSLSSYLNEDLNFTEIAKEENVTKQAIFRRINSSIDTMKYYEKSLHCLKKRKVVSSVVKRLNNILTKQNSEQEILNLVKSCQESLKEEYGI